MPEFYRHLLIWVAFPACVFWVGHSIFGRIVRAVCNIRFRIDAPLKPVFPTDPRLPNNVRWFFADVWGQLQSLGFEPAIYLRQDEFAGGQVGYLMMFEHPVNQDGAAAFASFTPGRRGPLLADCHVEYSTESPERVDVSTCNVAGPDIYPRLPNERPLRIPGMRDLAALYNVHRTHFAASGLATKRQFPAPTQIPTDMRNATIRRFQQHAVRGAMRINDDGRTIQFNWQFAAKTTWKLMPVVSRLRSMRARRRARRWLTHHGLPSRYERVDYRPLVADQAAFAGGLPVPDWYPSPNEISGQWFTWCHACRRPIATTRADCEAVECSSCGMRHTRGEELSLVAFDA